MSTDTREATPRPWAIDPDDRPGMEWNIHIAQADDLNRRIAFMTSNGPSEANAALIVRAVNHFDEAVEVLRLAREYFSDDESVAIAIDTVLLNVEASHGSA